MSREEADAILENMAGWRGGTMSPQQFALWLEALGIEASVDVERLRQTLEDVLGPLE
jgi:hypothetical protein